MVLLADGSDFIESETSEANPKIRRESLGF
jgi:hypothetical protein